MTGGDATKGGSAGFTLLETLLAIMVLGLVMATLQEGIAVGLRARTAQERLRGPALDFEPVEHAVRRMIEAMDAGTYADPPELLGTRTSLAFTTDLPAAALSTGQEELALRAKVVLGQAGDALVLRWLPSGVRLFGSMAPNTTVLTRDVESLAFDYGGADGRWLPAWAAKDVPVLVRLTVTFTRASGRHWPAIIGAPLRERPEE